VNIKTITYDNIVITLITFPTFVLN